MTEVARPRHSIRFHGRSYHAMVLAPEPPMANWLAELDTWLERSPGFFFGRPVVLDVAVLQPGSKQGLAEVLQSLAGRNIKVMGIEGAVNIVFRSELASASDPVELRAQLERDYRERLANPYIAAARGYLDDVIEPRETRPRLISALEMLQNKRDQNPPKKHGNIPL